MALGRTREEWLADGRACLEAALLYCSRGWAAIPLCPPDHVGVGLRHAKDCKAGSWGKAPLVGGWTSFAAPPSAAELRFWWRQWPNANVGIVMGKVSGLVGVDVDGEAAETELLHVAADSGLPPALFFRTPGAGNRRRLLFRLLEGQSLPISFLAYGEKQELRLLGDGSQTVAPPSRHQRGGYYEWGNPA